ncbi:sporulation integral membrane protein YtvI [Numidum massiliense]|uniref:sporulation integral membrane protein YtvI n=1 Tax=Numidum massiliense TaxID=1522315 RepID=UPI0006D55CAD|nr:sporulation integral membrane protein YtvI [Numidum massiliense]
MPIFNVTLVHRIFRAVWVAIVTVTVCALLYYSFPIIYPFLLAWVLAYAMNPLVRFFERKCRFPRWIAVTATLLLFAAVLSLIVFVFTTKIIAESSHILSLLQEQLTQLLEWLDDYFQSADFQHLLSEVTTMMNMTDVQSLLSDMTSTISNVGTTVITYLFTFLKSTVLFLPKFVVITVIVMVATFLISKQWDSLAEKSASLIPKRVRSSISALTHDLQKALFGYIKGHLILSSITAFVFYIGLLILGAPNAFTIAIIGGIIDLIPLVGIPAIIVPWSIFAFFDGNVFLGTGLLVLWPIILATRHSFEPKVYGASIGLNPLLLLVFIFAGLKLFGVLGIFIGILALVALTTFQKANVFRDLWRYIMTGKMTDPAVDLKDGTKA